MLRSSIRNRIRRRLKSPFLFLPFLPRPFRRLPRCQRQIRFILLCVAIQVTKGIEKVHKQYASVPPCYFHDSISTGRSVSVEGVDIGDIRKSFSWSQDLVGVAPRGAAFSLGIGQIACHAWHVVFSLLCPVLLPISSKQLCKVLCVNLTCFRASLLAKARDRDPAAGRQREIRNAKYQCCISILGF